MKHIWVLSVDEAVGYRILTDSCELELVMRQILDEGKLQNAASVKLKYIGVAELMGGD